MRLSFVVPAFGEAENLQALIPRLLAQRGLADDLEVLIVDDHSPDTTFDVVRGWAARDPAVKGLRLARNAGSHMAILCGLSACTGDAVIVLAADGQDPPELAPRLVEQWRAGSKVVWAVRGGRVGESVLNRAFSRLYFGLMNRFSTVTLPSTGADFFLLDRQVVEIVRSLPERNTSLFALISWLGFSHAELPYDKQVRSAGRSKWTLRRRIRMVFDSFFSFSTLPLRLASAIGLLYAVSGFAYAAMLVANKWTGGRLFGGLAAEGWSALMVAILISSGTLMLVLGVFGEYLWRTLEEVRGRPRFVVEERVNLPSQGTERQLL